MPHSFSPKGNVRQWKYGINRENNQTRFLTAVYKRMNHDSFIHQWTGRFNSFPQWKNIILFFFCLVFEKKLLFINTIDIIWSGWLTDLSRHRQLPSLLPILGDAYSMALHYIITGCSAAPIFILSTHRGSCPVLPLHGSCPWFWREGLLNGWLLASCPAHCNLFSFLSSEVDRFLRLYSAIW